eukprot:659958-Prymnesium_polylepis.2
MRAHGGSWDCRGSTEGRVGARKWLVARCVDELRSTDASGDGRARRSAASPGAESVVPSANERAACELWLAQVPKQLAPVCDGLRGECIPPPDAYPGLVQWPSARCARESEHATGADRARLCERTPRRPERCVPCA